MPPQAQSLSVTINGQIQTMNFASGNFFSQAAQIASAEGLRRRRKANSIAPWLRVIGLSFGAALAATDSSAEEAFECIQRPVAFDGIAPLSYATVTGAAGSKAYLHAHSPEQCATTSEDPCGASAYVLPGDVVAMAKTCGPWAYVQYIGEKHVTTGWMRTADLGATRDVAPRQNQMSYGRKEPVFALTRGRGVPVCEAYLQRLNQSQFKYPAYCGRPEDDQVPGFQRLNRISVSNEEVKKQADLVAAITSPISGIDWRDFDEMNSNGGVFTGTPYPFTLPRFTGSYSTWGYDPPIDIDNDGSAEKVIIWNLDSDSSPFCGRGERSELEQERSPQIPLVMTSDGSTIDQASTIRIFGHPDGGYVMVPGTVGRNGPVRFLKSYRVIGSSYGVFRYRKLYYFDTFYDAEVPSRELGDIHDQRRGSSSLLDTLAVFVRRDGKTFPICKYFVTQ